LPRPDWAFLIDIDAETAFGRKPDLPSVSHNAKRIRLYLDLCKQAGVKVMNGRRSSEIIHQEVWEFVSSVPPAR
jgi:thymidylate kinase